MALIKRTHNLKSEDNTGFGASGSNNAGRFYNRVRDRANVEKKGVSILERYSWYHTMLGMNRAKFLSLIFLVYILANLVFSGIYYLIGINHLSGINTGSDWKNFSEVFFFSTQTFTTVGYGRISPTGFLTSAVATFEAFLGLLSFAIATGLFYGRFARPRAFLKFSHNALIAPYKDGAALMFRICPYKNNTLSEAEVKVTMAMQLEENGKMANKFYTLDIEISKINSLALSWTIVHPINEKSPFYGFSRDDIKHTKIEVLVFVQAFDEVFSNTVVDRTSYISEEIVWGGRFKLMYHPSGNKTTTILDLNKLNDFDPVEIPFPAAVPDSIPG
ncbi:MAG: ion channel [Bacteroidota bacterium]